jgi:class 3 adenylate cyclase
VAELDGRKRAQLPNSAFAYVDSKGRKRLPINDEAHVRNALARFNQVRFEDEAAREKARRRLLNAARKYGIVPIGFMDGQLRAQTTQAVAGRLVIELGQIGAPGELDDRLRVALRDPTLLVLHWSESAAAYIDGTGRSIPLPTQGDGRALTLLKRHGRPMTALVHDPAVLANPELVKTVTAAVRLAIENERLLGEVEARASEVETLPVGFVTFLLTDIEDSTSLIRRLGDDYAGVLNDVRSLIRVAVSRAGGREVDARADEFFAVFESAASAVDVALSVQRTIGERAWPDDVGLRLRIGIHSGRPTLTSTGYVGMAVHTAARVCSAARGGQVLLSAPAYRAIEGALPAGISAESLGPQRLRSMPEPLELFQLAGQALARFEAPRVLETSAPSAWSDDHAGRVRPET